MVPNDKNDKPQWYSWGCPENLKISVPGHMKVVTHYVINYKSNRTKSLRTFISIISISPLSTYLDDFLLRCPSHDMFP